MPEKEVAFKKVYTSIEEALKNKKDVYILHISDTSLNIKVEDLIKLKKLQRINLSCKIDLDTFPGDLVKLKNLQWVKIYNNNIRHVSRFTQYLEYLEILYLENNEITEFPVWLNKYNEHLEFVSFKGNKICGIPREIKMLKNISVLDLSDNNLKTIPYEIGELENLTNLNIGKNQISEIPPTISNLYGKLRKLYIGGNPISTEHFQWLSKQLPYTEIDTNNYWQNPIN